tara:strand:+ start:20597 stop:22267 length:1671 start_codon:yes stop_codon:yes gene_type:complete
MLRIGILTDGEQLSAWAFEMLSKIQEEGYGEIVLIIENQTPKSSGKKSPLLYRIYRAIDRRLFRTKQDAFSLKKISDLPNFTAQKMEIWPVQKKYTDDISSTDLDSLRTWDLDIIIRLGFRILKGEILRLPKYGVWSYHHGDNRVNRGGPPCFWEVMKGEETTGSILQILSEKLDDGQVIYRSWSHTDPLSVQRNANRVFWKSCYFAPRMIKKLSFLGEQRWKEEIQRLQDSPGDYTANMYRPPNGGVMFALWVKLWVNNGLRIVKEYAKKPHWEIFISSKSKKVEVKHSDEALHSALKPIKDSILASNFTPLISTNTSRYYADPFVVERDAKTYLFFEDYDKKSKKARISFAEWKDGQLAQVCPIIEESWHLSYPFIWEHEGDFYLIPESAEAGHLFLYKAESFPNKWVNVGVWFEGEAYDPTVHYQDDKYWLFVNQKSHQACSSFDELYLYYSDTFLNPTWVSHPMNPIVSDVRNARPAGKIFANGKLLIRPAQDSGKFYGHRIKLQSITVLTKDEYREETVDMLESDFSPTIIGTHTVNSSANYLVLDGYSRQ